MPVITPHIPEGLIDFMKTFAKSVLKEKPENIYEFATVYFENLLVERDGYLNKGYEKFKTSEKLLEAREKCLLTQIENFHYRDKKKPQSITITGKDDENEIDDNPELLSPNSLQNKFKPRKLSSKKPSENLLAIKEEEDEENSSLYELNIENNHSLKDQHDNAAITIQKNVRGYITRKALQKGKVETEEKMEGKECTEEISEKIDIKENEYNIKNIQNTNNNGGENSNNQPNPKEENFEQNDEKVLERTITSNSEESKTNDKKNPKEINSIIETSESHEINDSKENNKIENRQKAGINDTIQDKTDNENNRVNEGVLSVKEISEDMQKDAVQNDENLPLKNEADVAIVYTKLEENSIDNNSLTDTIQFNSEIVSTISDPGIDSMDSNINPPFSERTKEKNNGNNKVEDNVEGVEDSNATKVSEKNKSTIPMEPIFADPILKEAAQNEQNTNPSITEPAKEESASNKAENIEDGNNNATKVSENNEPTFTMETILTDPILKEAAQNGQKEDISKQKLDLIDSPRENVISLESLSTPPRNSVDVNENYGTQNNEQNPKNPEAKDFKENPKSIESMSVKQESNTFSIKDEQNIENQSNQSETPEKFEIEKEKPIENQDHVKEPIVQDVVLIKEKEFLEDKENSKKEEVTNGQQNSENQLKQIWKDSQKQNEVNSENLTESPNKIEQEGKSETKKQNSMKNQEIVKESVVQKEPDITDINEKPLVGDAKSSANEVRNVHEKSENRLSEISKSPQKQKEGNSHNSTENLNKIEQETKSETEKQNSMKNQEIVNQSVVQKESNITDINEKPLVEDAQSSAKEVTNVHENTENGLSEISKSPQKRSEVNSHNSTENLNKIEQEAKSETENLNSMKNQEIVNQPVVQTESNITDINEKPLVEDAQSSAKEVTNVHENSDNGLSEISKSPQKRSEVNSHNSTENLNKIEQEAKSETEKLNSMKNQEIVNQSVVQKEPEIADIKEKPLVQDVQSSAKEVTNVHENTENGLSEISKSPQKRSEINSHNSTESFNKIEQEAKSETEKLNSMKNQEIVNQSVVQKESNITDINEKPLVEDAQSSAKEVTNVHENSDNGLSEISKSPQKRSEVNSHNSTENFNNIEQEAKSEIEKEMTVQNQNYTKEKMIQEEPDVVKIKDDNDNSVKKVTNIDQSSENEINQISKDPQKENKDNSLDLADSQNKIHQESKQSDELIQSGEITVKGEVSENIPRKSVWYVGSEPIVASNITTPTDQISEDSKIDENIKGQSKSASNDAHLDSAVSAEVKSDQEELSSEINVNNEKSKKLETENEKLSEKQLSQVKNEISKIDEEAAENADKDKDGKEKNINNIKSESEKSEEKSLNLNKEEINQNEKDQSEENEKDDKIQIQNSRNGKKNKEIIEKENKLSDDDTLKEMSINTLKKEDNNMLKLEAQGKDENPELDISNIGNELPVTTNSSEQIDLNKETTNSKKTNENVELPSEAAKEVEIITDPNIKQDSEEEVKEEIPLETKKNVKQLEVYPYEVRVFSKSAEKQKDQKNNTVDLQKIEAEIIDYENEMKSVNSAEKDFNKQGEVQVEKKGVLTDNNSKSDSIKGNDKGVSRSGSASMKAVEFIEDKNEKQAANNNDNNGKEKTTDSDSLEKDQINTSKDTEQSELIAENLHNVRKEEKRDEDEERYENESRDNEKDNQMELKVHKKLSLEEQHESEVLPSKLDSNIKEPSEEKPEQLLNNKDNNSEKMSSAADRDEKITSIHEKEKNQSESERNTEEGKTDDTKKTIESSKDQVLQNDAKNENLSNLIEKDVKLNEGIELKEKDFADKVNKLKNDENTKNKETEMEEKPVIEENKVFERKENNSKTDDNKKVNELNTTENKEIKDNDDDPVANTENNLVKSQSEPITSRYNNIKLNETGGIEQNKNVENVLVKNGIKNNNENKSVDKNDNEENNVLNNDDVEINKDSNSDEVGKVITTSDPSETDLQKQDVKQNEITKNVNDEFKSDNHLATTPEENQTISSKELESNGNISVTKSNKILQKFNNSNSNIKQSQEDNQKSNEFTGEKNIKYNSNGNKDTSDFIAEDPTNEAPQLTEEKEEAETIEDQITKANLIHQSISKLPSTADLSDVETTRAESRNTINDDLSEIENIDISTYGEDSLEAMYYSLRKNEIMLDRMQRRASSERKSASTDRGESFIMNELKKNLSQNSEDDVVVKSMDKTRQNSAIDNNDEIIKNPIEISIKNTEKLIEKLHESKSSPFATGGLEYDSDDEDSKFTNRSIRPYSPRIRMANRSPTPVSEYPKSVSFESPIDVAQKRSKHFIDHLHAETATGILAQAETSNVIRQKMLASSISETDSEYYEAPEEEQSNAIHDDYNISTALEMTSTDTDSTIISAATKIQAGARGFLTRRRLRRASTGTILSDSGKKASFGNDAIGESLESLLEENNGTTNIQKSYREYLNRKGNGKSEPVIIRNSSDISTPPKSDSVEDKEVMGITEVKLEQKQAATSPPGGTDNDDNHSIDENKAPDDANSTSAANGTSKSGGGGSRSLDDGPHGVTLEGLNLAARRLTLQRGDAVQKDSSPEEENGYVSGRSQLMANNNNTQATEGSKDEETSNLETINSKPSLDKRKSGKKEPWQYFGIRQRTMPVQVDSEIFRLVPKHMRKRIKSAETQKKKW